MEKRSFNEADLKVMDAYGISPETLNGAEAVSYEYGETLYTAHSPFHAILLLSSGRVKVSAEAANGRNLILCYYVSSGFLGDIELMQKAEDILNTVQAQSPVDAVRIPYPQNEEKLMNNLVFMRHLASDLASKLAASAANYASNALDTAEQRLAKYILSSAHKGTFAQVMSDVAMSTGMSYRHMYRILESLCEEGILKKESTGYHILDLQALENIAADRKKPE